MTILYRDEFPSLLKALQFKAGVELGVAEGVFSDRLLRGTKSLSLTGIDKWNDERHGEESMKKAQQRLKKHGGRVKLIRSTFSEACKSFADDSLDFVYVDGYAHTGQEDGETILEWWSKIKPGGLMAGHDYHAMWPKVVSAVNRFAAMVGCPLFLTSADTYPSWYMWKPGPDVKRGEGLIPGLAGCPVQPDESCIVVGNGPSLNKSGLGDKINQFSQVVRCNDFRIRGHMVDVGTKVTLWVSNVYNKLPHDFPVIKPKRILYRFENFSNPPYPPEELWRIKIQFVRDLENEIRKASKRPESAKAKLMASTGMIAVLWLLHKGVKVVHLAGFDHFNRRKSKDHHYFRKGNFGETPEHDGAVETEIFTKLRKLGKVVYLDQKS